MQKMNDSIEDGTPAQDPRQAMPPKGRWMPLGCVALLLGCGCLSCLLPLSLRNWWVEQIAAEALEERGVRCTPLDIDMGIDFQSASLGPTHCTIAEGANPEGPIAGLTISGQTEVRFDGLRPERLELDQVVVHLRSGRRRIESPLPRVIGIPSAALSAIGLVNTDAACAPLVMARAVMRRGLPEIRSRTVTIEDGGATLMEWRDLSHEGHGVAHVATIETVLFPEMTSASIEGVRLESDAQKVEATANVSFEMSVLVARVQARGTLHVHLQDNGDQPDSCDIRLEMD